MTTPDPCAKKLAQIVAALRLEAEWSDASADMNESNATDFAHVLSEYALGRLRGKAEAQTQHARRLREIIEEAGK